MPQSLRYFFFRALRLRCPACGGGPVFVTWHRMCPSCPNCGLRFDREPEGGYWVGSNTINLFTSEAVFAVYFVSFIWLTWPTPPWDAVLWAGMALMVLFPIFFFPWSKTLFVAVDLVFRPPAPEDFEQPREPSPAERNRPS
jgi:uncharacterized protein (DUF983 family)